MTNDEIKTLALSCGFTQRPQDNGEMDLNPYVYESHKKAYDMGFADGAKHSEQVCKWWNNKSSEAWSEWSDCGDYSSDCGLEWNMSNDDNPTENDMNFCPKCGKKIVEIQPPSEVQSEHS